MGEPIGLDCEVGAAYIRSISIGCCSYIHSMIVTFALKGWKLQWLHDIHACPGVYQVPYFLIPILSSFGHVPVLFPMWMFLVLLSASLRFIYYTQYFVQFF